MGIIDRLFDVFQGANPFRASARLLRPVTVAAGTGQTAGPSGPVLQTPEERATVRRRMEADLDEQRARRDRAPANT